MARFQDRKHRRKNQLFRPSQGSFLASKHRNDIPAEAAGWPIIHAFAPVDDVWIATGYGTAGIVRRSPEGRLAEAMFKFNAREGVDAAVGGATAEGEEKLISSQKEMVYLLPPFEEASPKRAAEFIFGAAALAQSQGWEMPGVEAYLRLVPRIKGIPEQWRKRLVGPGGMTPAALMQLHARLPSDAFSETKEPAVGTVASFRLLGDEQQAREALRRAGFEEDDKGNFALRRQEELPPDATMQHAGYVLFSDGVRAGSLTLSMASRLLGPLKKALGSSIQLAQVEWTDLASKQVYRHIVGLSRSSEPRLGEPARSGYNRSVRRALLLPLVLVALAACASDEASPTPQPPPARPDPMTLASPFVGSGGFGFNFGSAFPGALSPQGLAKVGPDTSGSYGEIGFLHYSGYWYSDDTIVALSHLHLHGTGATDYGVLGVMPLDSFDAARIPRDGHASTFQKSSEQASPGYYAATLDKGNIRVELTATEHVAHHRYTYPAGAAPSLLFDLTHSLSGGRITSVSASAQDGKISGRLRSIGGMSGGFGGYDVFFEARTSRPWRSSQSWSGKAAPADGSAVDFAWPADLPVENKNQQPAGLALQFDAASEPLELRVALSLVSAEGAAANLAAESPDGTTFDQARARVEAAWKPLVGAVEVEGASDDDMRTVASALYHLYMMPTRVEDADGRYRSLGDQVGQAQGYHYCSDLSLWDTYRTLHPMYALLSPDRDRDAVRSLHAMAQAGGFFPRWPIATGEAGTMIGSSAEVVLADAIVKGITDFDAQGAYALLRAAALDPQAPPKGRGGRDDIDTYLTLGYVPASVGRSVSKTVEYAVNDMALAQLARAVGQGADADALDARSHGWKQLYDPETGFLRARNADGTWAVEAKKFSPLSFSDDYAEATGWHTIWGPLHDVQALTEAMGGNEAFVAKLEEFFDKGKQTYDEHPPDGTLAGSGMRPYFWASNEPVMHAVYLFAQAGRPDLTQKWVRWIQRTVFRAAPDGLPGNDDGGTMSAWYLFNALGFYPLAGTDRYFLGAPLFPKLTVHLPAGGDFTVEAPGVSETNLYVQSVELNGAPLSSPELRHADLKPGGSLRFTMGPEPGGWGRK